MQTSVSSIAAKPLRELNENSWRSFPRPQDAHFATSERLILAAAEKVDPGEALILGAGECFEIPLRKLASRFHSVTLLDFKPTFLETGIVKAGLSAEQRQHVRTVIAELNGFQQQHVLTVLADLQHYNVERAADALIERLCHLAPKPFEASQKADLIVASCVMSQLHMPLLHGIMQGFEALFPAGTQVLRDAPRWQEVAFSLSEQIEDCFIHTLRRNLADGGRVYFAATLHLLEYRVTESGDWQSPGCIRVCQLPSLDRYTQRFFRTEQCENWWWDITPDCQPGQMGHGYRVEGAVLTLQ